MLKKGIIFTLLCAACVVGGYLVYQNLTQLSEHKKANIEFIPAQNLVFLAESQAPMQQINDFFSTSLVWKKLKADSAYLQVSNLINEITHYIQEKEISLLNVSLAVYNHESNMSYVLLTQLNQPADTLFKVDENGHFETQVAQHHLYGKVLAGRVAFATAKNSLESLQNKPTINQNANFAKVYKQQNTTKNQLSFGFPIQQLSSLNTQKWNMLNTANWGWYDMDYSELALSIHGFSGVDNKVTSVGFDDFSTAYYNLLPSNIEFFNAINKQNLAKVLSPERIAKANKACNCEALTDAFYWVDEQVFTFSSNLGGDNVLAFKLKDKELFWDQASTFLTNISLNDSSAIHQCEALISFETLFNTTFEPNAFTFINDYVLFAVNKEQLIKLNQLVASNRNITANKDLYHYLIEQTNANADNRTIASGFLFNEYITDGVTMVQHTAKQDSILYSIVNYSPNYTIGGITNNAIWELFFDAPLYNNMHLIANHRIKGNDLLVQDTLNTIYLVSASGTVKWKKKLDSKIIGDIKKIDFYRNAKYQLVFNTTNKLYILDILGRNVKGFPVNLDSATNEVNMFDYDNNWNYRFIVATQKGIQNINKEGKRVQGWLTPKTKAPLNNKVRHMRVKGKDYLIVNDNEANLYFYSRKGEERHKVSNTYSSDYLPVDFGNSVSTSRTVYLDKASNSIKKHFFNNTEPITVLSPADSILDFQYVRFLAANDKNYLVHKQDAIQVFDKAGKKQKSYPVPQNITNIKVYKSFFTYLNPVTNEFVVQNKNNPENTIYYNQSEASIIDAKASYVRVFVKKGNKLQMVIHTIN